jgi:AcrR family transcriptional regulator
MPLVSPSRSLYQHFASKRELYLAVEETGHRLLTLIEDARDADGPRSQVVRGFVAYFRWVAADRDEFLLLFGSGARRDEEFAEAVRRVEEAVAEAIAPLIRADIDVEHQRLLATALVGLAESTSRRLVAHERSFDPERVGAQVADLAWAGLRAVKRVG